MDGDKTKDEKNYQIRSMETDLKSQEGGSVAAPSVSLDLKKKDKAEPDKAVSKPKFGFAKKENTPKTSEQSSPFSKPIQKPYNPNKDLKMPPRLKPLPVSPPSQGGVRPSPPPSNIPTRPAGRPVSPSAPQKSSTPLQAERPINLSDILKETEKAPPVKPRPLGPPPITPSDKGGPNLADEFPKIRRPHHAKPKRIIILSVIAGLILLFIIGEIWWFFIRPSGSESVVDTTTNTNLPSPEDIIPQEQDTEEEMAAMKELEAPSSLINYNGNEIINLSTINSLEFSTKLESVTEKIAKDATLRLILTTKDATGERLLTLSELASILSITISPAVVDILGNEFDIFIFGGSTKDQTTCRNLSNSSTSCYGPRLGLVFKTTSDPSSALRAWEKTMVSNLTPLILSKAGVESGSFLNATYKTTPIRYKNLPTNTLTIEYAISGDLLLITTSKESMFKVIDSLK